MIAASHARGTESGLQAHLNTNGIAPQLIRALYLSPHFDDVVLSCGGQIYERTRRGERVAVLTVCATPAPTQLSPFAAGLHARWSAQGRFDRAAEDRAALAVLNAEPIHLNIHDCIYRRSATGEWLYDSEEDIFGELSALEPTPVAAIAAELARTAALAPGAEVFAPAAIGNHVDHRLVLAAADQWSKSADGLRFFHYADYPYAASKVVAPGKMMALSDSARQAKIESLRQYRSQLSTFWKDETAMAEEVSRWVERVFG